MSARAESGSPAGDTLGGGVGQPLFERTGWWDADNRDFASLRAVNDLRLRILSGWTRQWFGPGGPNTVVDLGCGGGLMAVPLAREGARVVAVDRSLPALREGHAQAAPRVTFVRGDLGAAPVADGAADLVLLSDVLEHLTEPATAIATAARLLRTGGYLFVNTVNRTLRARVLAVWLGEGLRLIPRGTHSARMFVRPAELQRLARSFGLRDHAWCGERPALWASLRRRVVTVRPGRSLAVGYCAAFRKEAA